MIIGTSVALWQAREAHRQAASAAAVKDFLITLFEANSLEQEDAARRRQLTAGQLLEEGAIRVAGAFQDQPELKLELQGVVGRLMHDVALTDQALALRTERVAGLTQRGAPAAERARALSDLADTLAQKGDLTGARKQLEGAIALLQTQSGRANAVLRWSLVSSLGYLGIESSDRAGAEAQLTQAVDQLRGLSPRSTEYAEALLRLAEARQRCQSAPNNRCRCSRRRWTCSDRRSGRARSDSPGCAIRPPWRLRRSGASRRQKPSCGRRCKPCSTPPALRIRRPRSWR